MLGISLIFAFSASIYAGKLSQTSTGTPPPDYSNSTYKKCLLWGTPPTTITTTDLVNTLTTNMSYMANGLPKSFFQADVYWSWRHGANKKMVENSPNYIKYCDWEKTQWGTNGPNDDPAVNERIFTTQGLNIYDGACWELAQALIYNKGLNKDALKNIKPYQNFISDATDKTTKDLMSLKVYGENGNWTYQNTPASDLGSRKDAYTWQFLTNGTFLKQDPFLSEKDNYLPWPKTLHWNGYSGITGEEAWASLLTPVQVYHLLKNDPTVKDRDTLLTFGENALGAIKAMQAPCGLIMRNVTPPGGTVSKECSLENNFSVLAGLNGFGTILTETNINLAKKIEKLKSQLNNNSDLGMPSKIELNIKSIKAKQAAVDANLRKVQEIANKIVNYFKENLTVGKLIETDSSGHKYLISAVNPNGTPLKDAPFAVDVQTWGIATLGTKLTEWSEDSNLPYEMLKSAIEKGGYCDSNNKLLGVGYTAQTPSDPYYECSGEWTFGAINAAKVIAAIDATHKTQAEAWGKDMISGVNNTTAVTYKGISYYLYANKRAWIPFGWWSNDIPAMASTTWALFTRLNYNPMYYGGTYNVDPTFDWITQTSNAQNSKKH